MSRDLCLNGDYMRSCIFFDTEEEAQAVFAALASAEVPDNAELALALAATRLADLIDRCQLYGPADAARGAVREVRAALASAAPPSGDGADAELGSLVRQMQLGHELWRVDDRADETPGWVLYNNNTETEIYCRGATPEQALRQALAAGRESEVR